jgi:high-affinity nickel-transport protein
MSLVATLVLGLFLGVRHATDTDHVVAVTAIVSRRPSLGRAMAIGALWGLGHTGTILVVGGAIVLFGLVIPPRLGMSMEMSVAAMLVVLGAMNLSGAARRLDEVAHRRQDAASGASDRHASSAGLLWALRPLGVGIVHGLAGSAAVALLVLATIRSAAWAMVYLLVFGAGTVVGMVLLTAAMAAPLAAAAARSPSFERNLARATGLVSLGCGLFLAYRIGFVDGLFLGRTAWSPH